MARQHQSGEKNPNTYIDLELVKHDKRRLRKEEEEEEEEEERRGKLKQGEREREQDSLELFAWNKRGRIKP